MKRYTLLVNAYLGMSYVPTVSSTLSVNKKLDKQEYTLFTYNNNECFK